MDNIPDFDPNKGASVDEPETDLGEFEFEVDALEAKETSDELKDEPEATDTSDAVAEAEPEVKKEEDAEQDADTLKAQADSDTDDSDDIEAKADVASADDVVEAVDIMPEGNNGNWIPKDRFNQVIEKRNEHSDRADNALQRVAELEAELKSQESIAVDAGIDPKIIKDAAEKVLDGDTESFANVLTELLNKQVSGVQTNNAALLEQATQNAISHIRQEQFANERIAAAATWEAKYPALDINNTDKVNTDALDEAVMLSGMYENKGFAPKVAMDRAVKAVIASYDLKQDPATMDAPAEVGKKPAPKRKAKTIKQPASIGEGRADKTDTPEIDSANISQDDWDALPDSVRDKILNE